MEMYTFIEAQQESVPHPDRGEVGDNYILVKFTCYKYIGGRPSPDCPIRWDSQIIEGEKQYWVDLPGIKNVTSPYRSICTRLIADYLSTTNVPEEEHPCIIDKLFEVLDVAVSPDLPIHVELFDVALHPSYLVPATRESIEGLERVRLDRLGVLEVEQHVQFVGWVMMMARNNWLLGCPAHTIIMKIALSSGCTSITFVPCADSQCQHNPQLNLLHAKRHSHLYHSAEMEASMLAVEQWLESEEAMMLVPQVILPMILYDSTETEDGEHGQASIQKDGGCSNGGQ